MNNHNSNRYGNLDCLLTGLSGLWLVSGSPGLTRWACQCAFASWYCNLVSFLPNPAKFSTLAAAPPVLTPICLQPSGQSAN